MWRGLGGNEKGRPVEGGLFRGLVAVIEDWGLFGCRDCGATSLLWHLLYERSLRRLDFLEVQGSRETLIIQVPIETSWRAQS